MRVVLNVDIMSSEILAEVRDGIQVEESGHSSLVRRIVQEINCTCYVAGFQMSGIDFRDISVLTLMSTWRLCIGFQPLPPSVDWTSGVDMGRMAVFGDLILSENVLHLGGSCLLSDAWAASSPSLSARKKEVSLT